MELPETFKAKNTVSDESSSVEDPNFRNRGVSPLNSTAQYDRSPKSKEQIAKLQLNSIVGIGNTLLSLSGKNDSDDYSYEEEEEEEEEEENKSSQINENNKNIETSSEAQKTDFSNEFADDDDEDIHNDDFNKENSPNSKNKNKNETENKNINKSVNKNVINKFENEKNNQNESQFEIIHSERDEEEDNLDKPGIFELIETEPERSKNNEESFENEEIDFKFDELKNLIPEMSDVAINDSNPPPLELSPEKQQPQDLISSVRSNKLSGRSSKSTIKSPQTSSRPTRPSSTMASSRKSGRNSIFQITSPNNQNLKTPNTPPNAKGFSIMSINDPQTFRKYIDGELDNPRAIKPNYLNYMNQKRHLETMMTHDEIVDFCQHAISTPIDKIRKPYDSPGDIRDIIGELNRLKVDAVTSCDYKLSKKIDDLIKHFRTQFRIYDRESCQKERVNEIKRKLDDAKITIKNTTAQLKDQTKAKVERNKYKLEYLETKQDNQLQDLEMVWREPRTTRKYTKRSPTLLNNQYVERHYALIGEYDQAAAVHKINSKIEKIETSEKHQSLNASFERARSNLLNDQEKTKEIVTTTQNTHMDLNKVDQQAELEKLHKRQVILENLLEEEADIDKFVAKRFKKASGTVLPMSVTLNGGTSLSPKKNGTSRDVSNMVNFVQTPIASPLPLPPLTVKKLKKPKKDDKKKKKPSVV